MIYLVEAVLPEGYFADDLRGLSADMAAFRDLLRIRLPRLAHHMDYLQRISDGKLDSIIPVVNECLLIDVDGKKTQLSFNIYYFTLYIISIYVCLVLNIYI